MFQPGDRVELREHNLWSGYTATVVSLGYGLKGPTVRVTFDDPEAEHIQSVETGWYAHRFVSIDTTDMFIPEDWS